MFLNALENFVSEEELLQKIAQLIIDGNTDEELSSAGYPDDLIERGHLYSLSLYF